MVPSVVCLLNLEGGELAARLQQMKESHRKQLALEKASWDAECATLEAELAEERSARDALGARLEEAWEEMPMLESRMASALEMVEQKDKEALEAAMMVKTAMERQMVAKRDLKLRTEKVYELRELLAAAPHASPHSSPRTLPPPHSQS